MAKQDLKKIFFNGIITENPTFRLVLGMCPTLGTTTSAENGFGMGVATMAVLILSNLVISLIKNLIRLHQHRDNGHERCASRLLSW